MLLGGAPGAAEEREGRVYVGQGGRELDNYLFFNGLDRDQLFLTNLVQTPGGYGADPPQEIIQYYLDHVLEEIREVDPVIVVTLGRSAARACLGDVGVEQIHGLLHHPQSPHPKLQRALEGRVILPCIQPAAGIKEASFITLLTYDFRELRRWWNDPDPKPQDPIQDGVYVELTTAREVEEVLSNVEHRSRVAVDTEGTVESPWGMQFCVDRERAWVIRVHSREALDEFYSWVYARSLVVVFHNALYDLGVLRAMGLDFTHHPFTDTMVRAYVLGDEPLGLKDLAYRHLRLPMLEYGELIADARVRVGREYMKAVRHGMEQGQIPDVKPEPMLVEAAGKMKVYTPQSLKTRVKKITRDVESGKGVDVQKRWKQIDPTVRGVAETVLGPCPDGSIFDVELDRAIQYAGRDAYVTLMIDDVLTERMKGTRLPEVMETDLSVIPMVEHFQRMGMFVDKGHYAKLSAQLQDELYRVTYEIGQMTGRTVNPNSPNQVAEVLLEADALPTRKTKKGKVSTDRKAMAEVVEKHGHLPVVQAIAEYREKSKLKTSFADVIPLVAGADGRVRCTFRVTRVPTGRLAASDPINLMAQPTRSEVAKEIRKGFIAPEGKLLGAWDFDQIEMRVMAEELHRYGFEDQHKGLGKLFRDGRDIHSYTAARMFGIRENEVDKMKHRYPAKRVGFGVITGITGAGLLDQLRIAGIGGWDEGSCDELIREYLEKLFPAIGRYMKTKREETRRNGGIVEDMWGRRRHLPAIFSRNHGLKQEAERQTHSHAIQGGAQGIMKRAMYRVWGFVNDCWRVGCVVDPILQVHDELVMEFEEGMEKTMVLVMPDLMSKAVKLSVPVGVEGSVARSWGDTK